MQFPKSSNNVSTTDMNQQQNDKQQKQKVQKVKQPVVILPIQTEQKQQPKKKSYKDNAYYGKEDQELFSQYKDKISQVQQTLSLSLSQRPKNVDQEFQQLMKDSNEYIQDNQHVFEEQYVALKENQQLMEKINQARSSVQQILDEMQYQNLPKDYNESLQKIDQIEKNIQEVQKQQQEYHRLAKEAYLKKDVKTYQYYIKLESYIQNTLKSLDKQLEQANKQNQILEEEFLKI